MAGIILKIIFEIEGNIKKDNSEIIGRLKSLQEIINTPHPPNWKNYSDAQNAILLTIREFLDQDENIHLEMIGVSARYSWRMVEDEMAPIIKKYETKIFEVDVIVTEEKLLKKWGLVSWIQDLKRTLNGIADFQNQLKDEVMNGRLKISKYVYDSLPQWHGVMINRKVLFLGRTKWILNPDGSWTFKVGQCEYRKFEPTDKFGGHPRIKMFSNWIDRLKSRDLELETINNT